MAAPLEMTNYDNSVLNLTTEPTPEEAIGSTTAIGSSLLPGSLLLKLCDFSDSSGIPLRRGFC